MQVAGKLEFRGLLWQEAEGGEHEEAWERLRSAHGILVPGGFGSRGVEGKILAAQHARENNIPYLGICLGMQVPPATPCPLLLTLTAAEHRLLHMKSFPACQPMWRLQLF